MDWPNHDGWMALAGGAKVEKGGETYVLRVVDCGDLVVPSGRVVALDPFVWIPEWARLKSPTLNVTPGRYQTLVTQAEVSGRWDDSYLCNAYATLMFSQTPEVRRVPLAPYDDGTLNPDGRGEEGFRFGVDSGTGCFADLLAVSPDLPIGAWRADTVCADRSTFSNPMDDPCFRLSVEDGEWWFANVFEYGRDDGWFNRLGDPSHLGVNVANVSAPHALDGANFVIFTTGWGDGEYALVGGYDVNDNLVRIHIDFQVVNPP